MKEDYNEKIKKYYNHSTFFYRHLWANKKNLAMHFGFWDKNTKNLNDALINENRYVAEILGIKKSDTVLDAGCGIGGSAIWIAENYGAKITGITIVEDHVKLAEKYAKGRGVSNLVKIELKDFCDTRLPSGSFNKIYGIESICYAIDKYDFLKEAHRLLKKGGKLAVCDGYMVKDELTEKETKYVQNTYNGWVLDNFSSYEDFNNNLKKLGYHNIEFIDVTKKIMKSSEEVYKSSRWIHPLVILLEKLHLTSETNVLAELACQGQYHMFKDGVIVYGVFIAQK
ncbi:MAG: class I SAM-dependent methyltransferase [Patescibacteria group bacterium]